MNIRMKLSWAALTLFGAVAGVAVGDDDVGVVHVSDVPSVVPASATNGADPAAPGNTTTTATPVPANGVVTGAPVDGPCDGGGTGLHCWNHCGHVTDGFGRPIATPISQEAVVYYHYWPLKWYGQPGWALQPQFPMVYMPTDTTQLGFYYSRVPQWLPNSAMYPKRPNPAEWNRRDYSHHGLCDRGCPTGDAGTVMPAGAVPGPPTPVAPTPVPQTATPTASPPTLSPVPAGAPSASIEPSQSGQQLPMPPAPAETSAVVPTNAGPQTGSASTAVAH